MQCNSAKPAPDSRMTAATACYSQAGPDSRMTVATACYSQAGPDSRMTAATANLLQAPPSHERGACCFRCCLLLPAGIPVMFLLVVPYAAFLWWLALARCCWRPVRVREGRHGPLWSAGCTCVGIEV